MVFIKLKVKIYFSDHGREADKKLAKLEKGNKRFTDVKKKKDYEETSSQYSDSTESSEWQKDESIELHNRDEPGSKSHSQMGFLERLDEIMASHEQTVTQENSVQTPLPSHQLYAQSISSQEIELGLNDDIPSPVHTESQNSRSLLSKDDDQAMMESELSPQFNLGHTFRREPYEKIMEELAEIRTKQDKILAAYDKSQAENDKIQANNDKILEKMNKMFYVMKQMRSSLIRRTMLRKKSGIRDA